MESIEDCPYESCVPQEIEAWRIVKAESDESIEQSFRPAAVIDPTRSLSGERIVDICVGWGISLYESEMTARTMYEERIARHSHLKKKIGSSFAKGYLEKQDGLIGPVDSKGHFTLFESDCCDLPTKFTVV